MSILEILLNPYAQDPAYHAFADSRRILGIPNFWNVVSNLPFLIVGALGLLFTTRNPRVSAPLGNAWMIFFFGILVTAFGSGYYHLEPDNASLGWDRLTMTIGFMSLFAIVIGEYLSVPWANRLLLPLLIAGAASVYYWLHSESLGSGDLRPYALVQFLPMLLLPLIMLLRRGHSDLGPYLGAMILLYVAAKLCEHFDHSLLAAGNIVSGHSIKHVLAALGPACLLVALRRRRATVRDFRK